MVDFETKKYTFRHLMMAILATLIAIQLITVAIFNRNYIDPLIAEIQVKQATIEKNNAAIADLEKRIEALTKRIDDSKR